MRRPELREVNKLSHSEICYVANAAFSHWLFWLQTQCSFHYYTRHLHFLCEIKTIFLCEINEIRHAILHIYSFHCKTSLGTQNIEQRKRTNTKPDVPIPITLSRRNTDFPYFGIWANSLPSISCRRH